MGTCHCFLNFVAYMVIFSYSCVTLFFRYKDCIHLFVPSASFSIENYVQYSNRQQRFAELNKIKFPRVLQRIKGGLVSRPDITLESKMLPSNWGNYVSLGEINDFVKSKAIDNNLIITVCDKGYLDVFRIFYRINKMDQYTNLVVFVLDKPGYDILSSEGYPVFHYKNNVLTENEASKGTRMWTSAAFNKMVLKLCVIRDVVNLNYNVLYIDSDIILFQNPFPELNKYRHFDIVAQRDDTLCAGFMYLCPTEATRYVLRLSIFSMYQRSIMDQDALHFVLSHRKDFMSGRDYAKKHQFIWDSGYNEGIISYHNNYIIMSSNKLYRWREQGFFLDDNGYYDTPPNGYVLVDNVQFSDLKRLSTFVKKVNRTLIMPTMPCPESINMTYCNICSWDDLCAYGFQHSINYNFRAHQILYDNRTSSEVLNIFKTGPVYEYKCNSDNPGVKENTIHLPAVFDARDIQPPEIRKLPLLHVRKVPSCIAASKIDIRGDRYTSSV